MSNSDKVTAAVTNNILFTSGQRGEDENGVIISPDVTEQTMRAMENLEKVITDNSSSLGEVEKITVFFSRHSDFLPVNLAIRKYFTDKGLKMPKCSGVETQKLPQGTLVEVEARARLAKG